ncbi:NAD(P)H-dependent oxidoreductase [Brenneria populi subsp. brevivirga]|uniref:FMN-dependent NADH-azoreductase n=1 Tax=Brenneria populi TaxID=1505588 RepID=UPI002E17CDF9|nr:NAD(P)H-dependent oxidoreductase [Brenneria populi subsp. brevivirga]
MSHILLVTSSPRGVESLSTRFAAELAQGIQTRTGGALTVRDLVAKPVPHITPAYISGRIKPIEARTPEEAAAVAVARELVDELIAADVVVLASGMINFGLPSQLKAWFDQVIWPGVAFKYNETGPQGLLTGKKVYVVTAAGGVYSEGAYAPFDFQNNYLLHLLGFIGLTPVDLVRIEGTVLGEDALNAAVADGEQAIQRLLSTVA